MWQVVLTRRVQLVTDLILYGQWRHNRDEEETFLAKYPDSSLPPEFSPCASTAVAAVLLATADALRDATSLTESSMGGAATKPAANDAPVEDAAATAATAAAAAAAGPGPKRPGRKPKDPAAAAAAAAAGEDPVRRGRKKRAHGEDGAGAPDGEEEAGEDGEGGKKKRKPGPVASPPPAVVTVRRDARGNIVRAMRSVGS
jgi:hypothetical protein